MKLAAAALLAMTTVAAADVGGLWEIRPLLVFAPDTAAAEKQVALLSDTAVREDLRLAVYVVTPAAAAPRFGAPPLPRGAAELRGHFAVAPGEFRTILIGLDGRPKLSAAEPLSLDDLSATIDRMPMRRNELSGRDG